MGKWIAGPVVRDTVVGIEGVISEVLGFIS